VQIGETWHMIFGVGRSPRDKRPKMKNPNSKLSWGFLSLPDFSDLLDLG